MCSWLDERGAKKGALVEIIDGEKKELYHVLDVYPPPVSQEALKRKEHHNRQFLDKEWRRGKSPS